LVAVILGTAAQGLACDNTCWLEKNKDAVLRHPGLKVVLDQICEQGRPITKRQRKIAKKLHLKKCGGTTPTATPTATASVTTSPTPTAPPRTTPTPTPSATPTPTPQPTPTVTPSPTPSSSPTPTPTPVCTPPEERPCAYTRDWWVAHEAEWPLDQVTIGNVT